MKPFLKKAGSPARTCTAEAWKRPYSRAVQHRARRVLVSGTRTGAAWVAQPDGYRCGLFGPVRLMCLRPIRGRRTRSCSNGGSSLAPCCFCRKNKSIGSASPQRTGQSGRRMQGFIVCLTRRIAKRGFSEAQAREKLPRRQTRPEIDEGSTRTEWRAWTDKQVRRSNDTNPARASSGRGVLATHEQRKARLNPAPPATPRSPRCPSPPRAACCWTPRSRRSCSARPG